MPDTNVTSAPTLKDAPIRLHHYAFVSSDQEKTRAFYEDVLGLPLTAFWIEHVNMPGNENTVEMSHAFYGLQDGGAVAFFNFADAGVQARFAPPPLEVFNHFAVLVTPEWQQRVADRLAAAQLPNYTIEHGYCRSLYAFDPDGLRLEFVVDHPDVENINETQLRTSHASLKRWMSGDRSQNNLWRPEGH